MRQPEPDNQVLCFGCGRANYWLAGLRLRELVPPMTLPPLPKPEDNEEES